MPPWLSVSLLIGLKQAPRDEHEGRGRSDSLRCIPQQLSRAQGVVIERHVRLRRPSLSDAEWLTAGAQSGLRAFLSRIKDREGFAQLVRVQHEVPRRFSSSHNDACFSLLGS